MTTAKLNASHITITESVPGVAPPLGHYSHVVELGNGTVYLSGQKAWHPQTGKLIDGDVVEQTELVFNNIERLLTAIDLDLSHIVRISCHLSDLECYEPFNSVYCRRLGAHKPARTTLAGYTLRGGALVELVVEAYRPLGTTVRES
jgi:2-iminobutanoate/2-iminopropanoate deaminase